MTCVVNARFLGDHEDVRAVRQPSPGDDCAKNISRTPCSYPATAGRVLAQPSERNASSECAQLARVGRPFQEYVMRNRGSPLHDRVQLWQGRDPGFHRDVWCACQTLPEYGHQLDGQTGMCFVEHAL